MIKNQCNHGLDRATSVELEPYGSAVPMDDLGIKVAWVFYICKKCRRPIRFSSSFFQEGKNYAGDAWKENPEEPNPPVMKTKEEK